MSLFFRLRFLTIGNSIGLSMIRALALGFSFVLLSPHLSYGISIHALYTAACQREIGVITHVSDRKIKMLTVDGIIKEIPRFEVIYLVTYPYNLFPFKGRVQNRQLFEYKVYGREKNQIVEILRGWPIGFTKEKISFLVQSGGEIAIDRRAIWRIEREVTAVWNLNGLGSARGLHFLHPPAFANCGRPEKNDFVIVPQQMLSDALTLKREFDFYQKGYESLEHYYQEQDFYAIPQVYTNKTQLGIWQDFNYRYGSSASRSSQLTPVFIDEISEDVFSFQRLFITGSAPIFRGNHEEVQTQVYYAFKGSYFRFSGLIDPNLILVGWNYNWKSDDFTRKDFRFNELSWLEIGFDFGPYSISFFPANFISVGVYSNQQFHGTKLNLGRFALAYQKPTYKIEFLFGGSGNYKEMEGSVDHIYDFQSMRVNLSIDYWRDWNTMFSYIHRTSSYSGLFQLRTESHTLAAFLQRKVTQRVFAGGYLSSEFHQIVGGESTIFPKLGISASLSF